MRFRRIALTVGLLLLARPAAAEPRLFVASYAAGEEGAISTLTLNEVSGTLQPMHTYRAIQFAYYLALAPDGKTL